MLKKFILGFIALALIGFMVLVAGNSVNNPKIEECAVKQITVTNVYEGGTKDLVFSESNGDFYYINRGLEQGMTIEGMKEKALNKEVTLHIAPILAGAPRHIAQLAVDGDIIYTEFDQ